MFSHANFYHLLLNIIVLLQFRPRVKTCIVAYIASVLAGFIPWANMEIPTCGLSGFLMACYARKYHSHRWSIAGIVLINLLFAFIPLLNYKIHLFSFFIAYTFYVIESAATTYRRSQAHS